MAIALVRGENFRLYRRFQIEPHPALNLVVGDNASGKTTLLEALFVASRAKSFRTPSLHELAGPSDAAWNVFLDARTTRGGHRVGVGWSSDGLDVRLDEASGVKVADLVRTTPLQLIDPMAHRMLDEGPAYRRSFIDWGVFHVEQQFLETWRRFQRLLRQRNKALRDGLAVKVVSAWNDELADTAEIITAMRERHVSAISTLFSDGVSRLLNIPAASISLNRGWSATENYREVLERNIDQHRKLATTVQGPHRAELRITVGASRAKGLVSRGQQKMLIAALLLAQSELLIASGFEAPILLLDDFASELAPIFQERLAAALVAYRGQKFITAFEFPAVFSQSDAAMFHVEHGSIEAVERSH